MVSTDDVTNLEIALLGRSIYAGGDPSRRLRVVLRLFDQEFADQVKRAFAIDISRSVSYLAAPAFAAALVGREVIETIPIGRACCWSPRSRSGPCGEVSRPQEVRLIAVRTGRGRQTLWSIPERRSLVRTDRMLVVAIRGGVADLLERATGGPTRRRSSRCECCLWYGPNKLGNGP